MDPADFQPNAPGKLVPASGNERRLVKGVPELVPVHGKAFVPDPLPPRGLDRVRFLGEISETVIEAERNLMRLEGVVAALPDPNLVLRLFRQQEASQSSRIEDTIASIEEMALVAARKSPVRAEAIEVSNNLRAIEHVLQSPLPICNRVLCEAHAILLDGVRGEDKRPGQFRSVQVHIGGSGGLAGARFVPPPPGAVMDECLRDMERYVNPPPDAPASDRFPLLVELAIVHYQFECIHPFSDGNGRLGRLLVNVLPVKRGHHAYPLTFVSEYLDRHRQAYYDGLLRVSTRGEWTQWVKFFCQGLSVQAAEGAARAKTLHELRNQYREAATTKRASALGHRLIDLLFTHQAVDTTLVARHLGVSAPSAQKHIDRFLKLKILTEITGSGYGRIYVAREIIRVIEERPVS